jgi:hypothetical protein
LTDDLDHEGIQALAKKLGRPAQTLIVLAHKNDPFNITPGRRADAEWFAALWKQFGAGKGMHIRRFHYRMISQPTPIIKPDGTPYVNTVNCAVKLGHASRDARYLGLVPAEDFVDRRNNDAIVYLDNTPNSDAALVEASEAADVYLPSFSLNLEMPVLPYL